MANIDILVNNQPIDSGHFDTSTGVTVFARPFEGGAKVVVTVRGHSGMISDVFMEHVPPHSSSTFPAGSQFSTVTVAVDY